MTGEQPPRKRKNTRGKLLTPCETKYLFDVAIGLTAKQSARKHGVTRNTVNGSLARARAALGADNAANAAVLGLVHGFYTAFEIHTKQLKDEQ